MLFKGLLEAEFEVLDLGDETVLLEAHEHLLLDSLLVLGRVLLVLSLQVLVGLLLLGCVLSQLGLLLLHTSVVDLLEVLLLLKFVVGASGLLSNDSSLIELLLQFRQLVRQLSVALVDLWNLWHLVLVELVVSLELAPLLLERLESFLHTKLDEEVAEELV